MSVVPRLLTCLVAIAVAANPAAAQERTARLHGVATRADNKAPVKGVEVILQGTEDKTVVTNEKGAFDIKGLFPGRYKVIIRSLGFDPYGTIVQLADSASLELAIPLRSHPITLQELVTTAERKTFGGIQGFEERRKLANGGSFIDAEAIEKSGALYACDLFRRVPGISVQQTGSRCQLRVRRSQAQSLSQGECDPILYVNGGRSVLDLLVENVIPLNSIAAVEVYRGGSQLPAQFNTPDAACGVVAIWTK